MFTICPNRASCPGQLFQAVKHFVSRGAMDIDGFGEKQAYRFLSDGLIKDVADIYALKEEQLVELEGFGEISAQNLLAAIEQAKEVPFFRVLYALGIPGIGYVNARNLARAVPLDEGVDGGDGRADRRDAGYRRRSRRDDRRHAG